VFEPPQKPWLWTEKKTVGTNFTIFGSKTAAKCGELNSGADRFCSRTGNKDEVLEGKT